MKGVIFNVLEDFVDEQFGEGVFDSLVEAALPDSDGVFVGPGTYPDEELFAIVGKALEVKGLELEPVLKSFGHYLFGKLAEKYPVFVEPYNHPKDFIKTVHGVIHVEVKKLFPEAETPNFKYSNDKEDFLTLTYESKRNLFPLAEGLISGAGDFFKSPIQITYQEVNPDENYCVFDLQFSPAKAA